MSRVFLSWSGEARHAVALALYEWLPVILQNVKPFMSSEDLRKGGRWNKDLAQELEQTNFGIACLTPDNLEAPWILFESGALSKFVAESNVMPFLVRVKPSDLPKPLTQFNAANYDKDDLRKVIKTINESKPEEAVSEQLLNKSLEACWPKLDAQLTAAVSIVDSSLKKPRAPLTDSGISLEKFDSILQDLVVLARSQSQLLSSPEQLLPPGYLRNVMRRVGVLEDDVPLSGHAVWIDLFTTWEMIEKRLNEVSSAEGTSESVRGLLGFIRNLEFPLRYLRQRLSLDGRGRPLRARGRGIPRAFREELGE